MRRRWRGSRPSPALLVAVLALVAALAGSAVAEVATTSKLNKKEKKQVKKIARKQINKLAPGLSVANADNATNADNADNAEQLGGLPPSAYLSSTLRVRIGGPVNVADGAGNAVNVQCQPGETIVGGGGSVGNVGNDVQLISSRPTVDNTSTLPADGDTLEAWRASAFNPAGGVANAALRVWAVCASN
jgi:hypothetical protein